MEWKLTGNWKEEMEAAETESAVAGCVTQIQKQFLNLLQLQRKNWRNKLLYWINYMTCPENYATNDNKAHLVSHHQKHVKMLFGVDGYD